MYFINKEKVKLHQSFILEKLNSFENINGLLSLLKNYSFKKYIDMYNYSKLL